MKSFIISIACCLVALVVPALLRAANPYPTIYPEGWEVAADRFQVEFEYPEAGETGDPLGLALAVKEFDSYWRGGNEALTFNFVRLSKSDFKRGTREFYYISEYHPENGPTWIRMSFEANRDGVPTGITREVIEARKVEDDVYGEMDGLSWIYLKGSPWFDVPAKNGAGIKDEKKRRLYDFAAFMRKIGDRKDQIDCLWAANRALAAIENTLGTEAEDEAIRMEMMEFLCDAFGWNKSLRLDVGRSYISHGSDVGLMREIVPVNDREKRIEALDERLEAEAKIARLRLASRFKGKERCGMSWAMLLAEQDRLLKLISGSEFAIAQRAESDECEAKIAEEDADDAKAIACIREDYEDNVYQMYYRFEREAKRVDELKAAAQKCEKGSKESLEAWQAILGDIEDGDCSQAADAFAWTLLKPYLASLEQAYLPKIRLDQATHENHVKTAKIIAKLYAEYRPQSMVIRISLAQAHLCLKEYDDARANVKQAREIAGKDLSSGEKSTLDEIEADIEKAER